MLQIKMLRGGVGRTPETLYPHSSTPPCVQGSYWGGLKWPKRFSIHGQKLICTSDEVNKRTPTSTRHDTALALRLPGA